MRRLGSHLVWVGHFVVEDGRSDRLGYLFARRSGNRRRYLGNNGSAPAM